MHKKIGAKSGFLTHKTTVVKYLFKSMHDLRSDPRLPNFTVNVEFM